MLIIWGKKVRYYPAGFAAKYCPNCSDVMPMKIDRINRVPHIYYLSLGSGENLGFRAECTGCRGWFAADDALAAGAIAKIPADFVQFVQQTNPALPGEFAARMLLLRKLRTGSGALTEDERLMLIVEPFVAVRSLAKGGDAAGALRISGVLTCAALSLMIPIWLLTEAHQHPNIDHTWDAIWGWTSFVSGILLAILSYYLASNVGHDKRARQRIARALVMIHPTREELETVLAYLRTNKVPSARLFKPDRLLAQIAVADAEMDGSDHQTASPVKPNYERLLELQEGQPAQPSAESADAPSATPAVANSGKVTTGDPFEGSKEWDQA